MSVVEIIGLCMALIVALVGSGGVGALVTARVLLSKLPLEKRKLRTEDRKLKSEAQKTEAETVDIYANVNRETGTHNLELVRQIGALECDLGNLRVENNQLRADIARLERRLIDMDARYNQIFNLFGQTLVDWMQGIHKDIDQLRAIGIAPAWVPYLPKELRQTWLGPTKGLQGDAG